MLATNYLLLVTIFMCGRFALATTEEIHNRFKTRNQIQQKSHYNLSPGMVLPVITADDEKYIQMMKWGLIPFWAKDNKIAYHTINARVEGIENKPAYRKPFVSQHCLIPATGFYEWQKNSNFKTPYYIYRKNQKIMSFAGLYDIWHNNGKPIQTFTIITKEADQSIAHIHNRMPIIFSSPDNEDQWLNPKNTVSDLLKLINNQMITDLKSYPVSALVNNPDNNSKDLIKPLI